ncbi:MAG TPA: adenylate kinase [Clostridiales bacterium]|nr:adenylate kinase [Clostridiales bacterium]
MNIIMMGAQGTGKGTVAGLLKDSLNLPHISTGDIFRKNIKEGTELGKIATQYADEGKLVPDEVTNSMVKNRLNEEDCKNGFILDGYPRNIAQAEELDRILNEKNEKVDLVVNLSTPTEEIIERVMARRECPKCKRVYNMILNKPKNGEICDYCGVELTKRKDDTEEKLQIRLDTFFKETKPVIDFYTNRGLVRNEEVSVSINRLGVDAAKSVVDFLKND